MVFYNADVFISWNTGRRFYFDRFTWALLIQSLSHSICTASAETQKKRAAILICFCTLKLEFFIQKCPKSRILFPSYWAKKKKHLFLTLLKSIGISLTTSSKEDIPCHFFQVESFNDNLFVRKKLKFWKLSLILKKEMNKEKFADLFNVPSFKPSTGGPITPWFRQKKSELNLQPCYNTMCDGIYSVSFWLYDQSVTRICPLDEY